MKKEPKYECAFPFRGVVKLGSKEYAFALDAVSPKPKGNAKKADAAGKTSKPVVEETKSSSPAAKWADKPAEKQSPPKPMQYNRLYFDLNNNGDMTDDKVLNSEMDNSVPYSSSYSGMNFPRIDIPLDFDGTKMDYSIQVDGYSMFNGNSGYVMLSFNAAGAAARGRSL